jgi:hypothetical protein
MRRPSAILVLTFVLGGLSSVSAAQEPQGRRDDAPQAAPAGKTNAQAVDAIVTRLMAFDKNKDGKLTRDEIVDDRLLRLFDRADANHDGVVTKAELVALATRIAADESDSGGRRRGFGPSGGPGGFGPGGFGGPPRPGRILPPFLQEQLKLTADQKQQLATLQKEVDEKLDKVLTDEQKQQLKDMRRRGRPGGRRGPGRGGSDGPQSDDRPSDRSPGAPRPDTAP